MDRSDHDRQPHPREDEHEFAEERESLWRITLGPTIWAFHFAISYAAVSVYCFRFERMFEMGWLRAGLIAMTLAMLVAIAWIGWRAFLRWDVRGTGEFSNPEGSAEDRHQFLGHAGFLLALVSFIGVVYDTLPLILLGSCR
ncbi:uncharacterized membrane protein YcjF (UPF0283 family) [Limimaricola variabilis]|jgi:hypothetical protein|uniref:Uncharacterized membrane protein YcjF (UPF0283 family) n=1 Tax=Limimaricola variabilis TaxID=1492771 RepID=A0ABR6HPU9_9RHOB|nr:hypothetical protein [Limimaricola variabilis]MBB3712597.1 uncharacterized membrane protein YcjF (UPF0283 family) [Limimaricola variabilis]WPY94807.1 hypothetical protein T8T21_01385 [Limimaricola variabilis]